MKTIKIAISVLLHLQLDYHTVAGQIVQQASNKHNDSQAGARTRTDAADRSDRAEVLRKRGRGRGDS